MYIIFIPCTEAQRTYVGVFFALCVCCHSVPISMGLGHYRLVSEPKFTPNVGNHLSKYLSSYQQYNQIQIKTHLYLNLGIPAMSIRISHCVYNSYLVFLYLLLSLIILNILSFFSLSLHPIDFNPLSLTHYTSYPPRVHYRYQSGAAEAVGSKAHHSSFDDD